MLALLLFALAVVVGRGVSRAPGRLQRLASGEATVGQAGAVEPTPGGRPRRRPARGRAGPAPRPPGRAEGCPPGVGSPGEPPGGGETPPRGRAGWPGGVAAGLLLRAWGPPGLPRRVVRGPATSLPRG